MDTSDLQQWNGYAYANNSPVTFSDPTGLLPTSCMDDGSNCSAHHPNDHEVASEFDVESEGGITAGRHKTSGRTYLGDNELPPGGPDVFVLAKAMREFQRTSDRFQTPEGEYGDFSNFQLPAMAEEVCTYQKPLCSGEFTLAVSMAKGAVTGAIGATNFEVSTNMLTAGASAAAAFRAVATPTTRVGSSWSATKAAVRECNSFAGDTPVLMADGSTKRIDDVKVGDQVFAADPDLGESGPEKWSRRSSAMASSTSSRLRPPEARSLPRTGTRSGCRTRSAGQMPKTCALDQFCRPRQARGFTLLRSRIGSQSRACTT
jgi:hypothetical protein